MSLLAYPFSIDASGLVYTFFSTGKRTITKKIIFTAIQDAYFNMELRTEEDGILLPDTENSNNGDIFSIFETCAAIALHFINSHPKNAIYIKGSDHRRQRRYHSMFIEAIKQDESLKVFGELPGGTAEPFQPDSVYEAFLVFHSN